MEAGQVQETETAEEVADFARVQAMAAGGDPAPGAPVVEAEPEAPKVDAAESLAGLLGMVSGVAGVAGFKATAELWKPETCQHAAAVTVPVLRKYPWGARVLDFLETGAGVEEMALATFLLPMGAATWAAIKADSSKGNEEKPHAAAETASQGAPVMREVHDIGNQ